MNEKIIWEQRWHPFRGEWVLFASHRGGRPWVGDVVENKTNDIPPYNPTCALCPGNSRVKGRNEDYRGVYVFTNDLPCFDSISPDTVHSNDLYRTRPARGTAEVICYHPRHDLTFADLSPPQAREVVQVWKDRTAALYAREEVEHVLIFENKGSLVGTSNPHPHCQIYAGNMVYGIAEKELEIATRHQLDTGRFIGMDIVAIEMASPRVLFSNEHFMACVPWFSRYAYEVLILPLEPFSKLTDLHDKATDSLADAMLRVSICYDNLWKMPLPYVMAFHQAPKSQASPCPYPFHIEYHPPLRNPTTMKFLAGPEIGGGTMTNESDPDIKAAELKAALGPLYRKKT